MRSHEELDQLSRAVRLKVDRPPWDDLMAVVNEEFEQYVTAMADPPTPEPPAEMVERLWSMGWLLYEITWGMLQEVQAGYEVIPDEGGERSARLTRQIDELAEVARDLPWPEYAPRALGAIRAQALAHSKRDTEKGFDLAWVYHEDANELYRHYARAQNGEERYQQALGETMIFLWLAQCGTSCRTAEQLIGQWAERRQAPDGRTLPDEDRVVQSMFSRLLRGVEFGEKALEAVEKVEIDNNGLAYFVDRDHLALVTGFRNPGIMATRAALLLLPLSMIMEKVIGRLPPPGRATWSDTRTYLVERIRADYAKIEQLVEDAKGNPVPLELDHQRSVVQIRLNMALVAPGESLTSRLDFDPCLQLDTCHPDAIAALCRWLADTSTGRRRGDANVIGSATMPRFIEGVDRLRASRGVPGGYREWRRDWFHLDRYADEPGRRGLVDDALGASPSSQRT